MGLFLVDLQSLGAKCLGAKDGFAVVLDPIRCQSTRNAALMHQGATTISLDLAAEIVREGIAYARSLGFEPHRDATKALPMLHGACPENCSDSIPVGGANRLPILR